MEGSLEITESSGFCGQAEIPLLGFGSSGAPKQMATCFKLIFSQQKDGKHGLRRILVRDLSWFNSPPNTPLDSPFCKGHFLPEDLSNERLSDDEFYQRADELTQIAVKANPMMNP